MSGIKYDGDKPDLSLISRELMEEVARVRMFGAKKYSRNNWMLGFKVTRSCAAALRHIFAFLSGETNDSESGLSHLAHAVCCLEHALYDMKHRADVNDDRIKLPTDPYVKEQVAAIKSEYTPEQTVGSRFEFEEWKRTRNEASVIAP